MMRRLTIVAALTFTAVLAAIQGAGTFNTASGSVSTTGATPQCFACVCAVAGAECE